MTLVLPKIPALYDLFGVELTGFVAKLKAYPRTLPSLLSSLSLLRAPGLVPARRSLVSRSVCDVGIYSVDLRFLLV